MSGDVSKTSQVTNDLRHRITSGDLPPGADVPTEQDLMDQYGYARGTVRAALHQLTLEGLIGNGHGRGRTVRANSPLTFHASLSESRKRAGGRSEDAWVADVTEQGRVPGQSITVAIEKASAEIAKWLEIKPGDEVAVRNRVRTVDTEAHNINATYYPRTISKGTPIESPDDVTQGVIKLMADLGYVQVRFKERITARMPTPDESRALKLPSGVPVMVEWRAGYTEEGRPVKVTITVWPSDRTQLDYDLPG